MPSRRTLLRAVGTAVPIAVAGCTGSGSGGSATRDCQTSATAHGDGDVLDGGAMATVDGDAVRLAIPLSVSDVRTRNVDALVVFDGADERVRTIPVSVDDADVMASKDGVSEGQLRYEQHLGQRPQHGQYRIVAVDDAGDAVDAVTIEFNCFADVEA